MNINFRLFVYQESVRKAFRRPLFSLADIAYLVSDLIDKSERLLRIHAIQSELNAELINVCALRKQCNIKKLKTFT